MISKYTRNRDRMRDAKSNHAHPEPRTCSPASRPLRTLSDTPKDLIVLRSRLTLRSRRVKPSMPKMPWDVETET